MPRSVIYVSRASSCKSPSPHPHPHPPHPTPRQLEEGLTPSGCAEADGGGTGGDHRPLSDATKLHVTSSRQRLSGLLGAAAKGQAAGDREGLCGQLGRPEGWNLDASPPRPLALLPSLCRLVSLSPQEARVSVRLGVCLIRSRTQPSTQPALRKSLVHPSLNEKSALGFPSPFLPPHISNKQARVWASARPRPARWGPVRRTAHQGQRQLRK